MTKSIPIEKKALVPKWLAEKVLTAGPDHVNYRGGVGSVMNVYARHFAVYKYVTTQKPMASKWQLIPFFIKQYFLFIRTLRNDSSIQIVHLQGSFKGSFYRKFILFVTAKYGFNKHVVYHMHGSKFDVFYYNSDSISKRLIRFLVERADVVLCLSTYWHKFFTQNFTVRHLEILGNVIHQRDHNQEATYFKPAGGPLNVLFLGAIGERKGIFDLLDVLHQYRSEFEGRLLLRIGGNGETERLIDYIAEHKLESFIQFEGWVSGDKKHELLSTSDVYILPSYHEGLPISILEAMNYHLPVISTPVGGTAEVVHEGVNGFLVEPGDKDALYKQLLKFIAEPQLVERMGTASGQLVRRYLPETIFPELCSIYETMLTNSN